MAQATTGEMVEDAEITTAEDEEDHLADKNDPTATEEVADTRTEDTASSLMAANNLHQATRSVRYKLHPLVKITALSGQHTTLKAEQQILMRHMVATMLTFNMQHTTSSTEPLALKVLLPAHQQLRCLRAATHMDKLPLLQQLLQQDTMHWPINHHLPQAVPQADMTRLINHLRHQALAATAQFLHPQECEWNGRMRRVFE